jgi:hypothetical protein
MGTPQGRSGRVIGCRTIPPVDRPARDGNGHPLAEGGLSVSRIRNRYRVSTSRWVLRTPGACMRMKYMPAEA